MAQLYKSDGSLISVDGSGELPNPYAGKKILWLGDSISDVTYTNYPKKVCNALGASGVFKASSGGDSLRMRNILQGLDGRTAVDLTNVDYCMIMVGHNCSPSLLGTDKIDDIPAYTSGTPYTDYEKGNYFCDVASCIEYIWDKNPNVKIFFVTPPHSSNTTYNRVVPIARQAMFDLGAMYSIPVIDNYAECGINARNVERYTYDGHTHPNDAGQTLEAQCVVSHLLKHGLGIAKV